MKIFIGWDSRFEEPAEVLAYSIRKRASCPVDIHFLKYQEIQSSLGFSRQPDPLASTEFTYTRFLVPLLCGYEGKALFMDNDMLCFGDVAELDSLDMDGYALRVTKHDYQPKTTTKMWGTPQTTYPRKLWSSFMLMNCPKLTIWSRECVETASGAFLHRFEGIPDEQIGDISLDWNEVYEYKPGQTKLLHYTEGGPWYENYRDCPYADLWYQERDSWKAERAAGQ